MFKKTRYFHISYHFTLQRGFETMGSVHAEIEDGKHFNEEEVISNVKAKNDMIKWVVILGWKEFKNKKDSDAFRKTESDGS